MFPYEKPQLMHLGTPSSQCSVSSSPRDLWREQLTESINYVLLCSSPPGEACGCSARLLTVGGQVCLHQDEVLPGPLSVGLSHRSSISALINISLTFGPLSLLILNVGLFLVLNLGEKGRGMLRNNPLKPI